MAGNFRSVCQGQLADWEGGKFENGTVTAATDASTFTDENATNTNVDFYAGRVLEFTTGDLAGQQQTILTSSASVAGQYVMLSAFTATPGVGDDFKIYPVGDSGTATADIADSTDYQTVFAWRNTASDRAAQTRSKFNTGNASISASEQIQDGDRVRIQYLHVFASLAYDFVTAASQKSSSLAAMLAEWVSEGVSANSTFVDDALRLARYRILRDGAVVDDFDGVIPASRLIVPAATPVGNTYRPAQYANSNAVRQSTILGFERSLDVEPRLERPINLDPGSTFEIQMKLTESNAAFEYDVWLSGFIT